MTNLIIISPSHDLPDESELVNRLFESGLELFHLRKPDMKEDEQRRYLEKIDPAFYNKISIHQHHALAKDFNLNFLHFKENFRNSFLYDKAKRNNYTISTSYHSLNDPFVTNEKYDYCFLGPVYNSISKKGYEQRIHEDAKIKQEKVSTKIFAIGGITTKNTEVLLKRGFSGVAVLGSIWEEPKKSLETFLQFKKICQQTVLSY